jgi:hypothetical protein
LTTAYIGVLGAHRHSDIVEIVLRARVAQLGLDVGRVGQHHAVRQVDPRPRHDGDRRRAHDERSAIRIDAVIQRAEQTVDAGVAEALTRLDAHQRQPVGQQVEQLRAAHRRRAVVGDRQREGHFAAALHHHAIRRLHHFQVSLRAAVDQHARRLVGEER